MAQIWYFHQLIFANFSAISLLTLELYHLHRNGRLQILRLNDLFGDSLCLLINLLLYHILHLLVVLGSLYTLYLLIAHAQRLIYLFIILTLLFIHIPNFSVWFLINSNTIQLNLDYFLGLSNQLILFQLY